MKQPTQRQQAVLDFLVAFQERMGRTPTGPEIAKHFGYRDPSPAYQHLQLLAKKGYLELISSGQGKALGVRLKQTATVGTHRAWPVLGSIPAGPLADLSGEMTAEIGGLPDLVPGIREGDYLLTVDGDSMIEAGLQPGQYVVICPTAEPKQGDICAVWVDGEGGTLKRIFYEGETISLLPANPRYTAKSYPADRVRIQGVLIAAVAVQRFRR
jgi:repressor LexA